MSVPLHRVVEVIEQFKRELAGLPNAKQMHNALDEARERIEYLDMRNWVVREYRPEGVVEIRVDGLPGGA